MGILNDRTAVSIIGLGSMGRVLAQLLLDKNYDVTIWNRTQEKSVTLVRNGASLAPDVLSAVEASPVIIVCVADYRTSDGLLKNEDVCKALKGKLLIQLSTGTPKEARDSEAWSKSIDLNYLDGAILVTPSQMGTEEAAILLSGRHEQYLESEKILKVLAPHLLYIGQEAGLAATLDLAFLSYFFSSLIGFAHAALICRTEGFNVAALGAMIRDWSPSMGSIMKEVGDVIDSGNYSNPKSSLKTCAIALELIEKQSRDSGISNLYPTFASGVFKRGIQAGLEAEDGAAIFKVLEPRN
jgi:3-hydroxyisobutyrate dehydrogenase-like beta-hydroxyacid dehydrogenase